MNPGDDLIDPCPNIHELFVEYNARYFDCKLTTVFVEWSSRMTLCAGLCTYHGNGAGGCSIKLSAPLLKYRPASDLRNTLLHECIHAYLFVTRNDRDRDSHGPVFIREMERVNKAANANVTIYHTFHDEVAQYRTHWWQCQGRCRNVVKRAMNRAPGPSDNWFASHRRSCGGEYVKISEPAGFKDKKKKGGGGGAKSKVDKKELPGKKAAPEWQVPIDAAFNTCCKRGNKEGGAGPCREACCDTPAAAVAAVSRVGPQRREVLPTTASSGSVAGVPSAAPAAAAAAAGREKGVAPPRPSLPPAAPAPSQQRRPPTPDEMRAVLSSDARMAALLRRLPAAPPGSDRERAAKRARTEAAPRSAGAAGSDDAEIIEISD